MEKGPQAVGRAPERIRTRCTVKNVYQDHGGSIIQLEAHFDESNPNAQLTTPSQRTVSQQIATSNPLVAEALKEGREGWITLEGFTGA